MVVSIYPSLLADCLSKSWTQMIEAKPPQSHIHQPFEIFLETNISWLDFKDADMANNQSLIDSEQLEGPAWTYHWHRM